ncbi:MAG: hypothetical protein KJ731_18825 [Alphaproteobacteria bacterium]|nr:hypothetical protein [Alphaproteobacteria bacterium]MBU1278038.1 hypothetical protein [Alphaproteobacteria bacterium]MBU1572025.1 hypothetical protein [Alphaproteobacteria bacterium]MBU1830502.1 hypothetical protein [Alphaproteobacteria bacterium]MBU2078146.1 hypothetical protein [Alphaproteobacteria bacterium]
MAVELIPQLPAQDSAVLSRGIAPRKSRGDSPKTDAISGVITTVMLPNIPCEGFISARFTLRKRQQESQDLGDLRGGESGSAQDDVSAEKQKRSAGFFFAI